MSSAMTRSSWKRCAGRSLTPPRVLRDYLSERDLAERWGVSIRTVQRRIGGASLSPVGVKDRLPHLHRRDVEARKLMAVRAGQSRILKSPIFSVCVAHRKAASPKPRVVFTLLASCPQLASALFFGIWTRSARSQRACVRSAHQRTDSAG